MRILNRKITKIIDDFTINCNSNVFPALTVNHKSSTNYVLKNIKYNNTTSNVLGHLTEHLDFYNQKGRLEYQLDNINKIIANNSKVLNEDNLIEKAETSNYIGLELAEKLFKAHNFALNNDLIHKKCYSGSLVHTLNHIDVSFLFHFKKEKNIDKLFNTIHNPDYKNKDLFFQMFFMNIFSNKDNSKTINEKHFIDFLELYIKHINNEYNKSEKDYFLDYQIILNKHVKDNCLNNFASSIKHFCSQDIVNKSFDVVVQHFNNICNIIDNNDIHSYLDINQFFGGQFEIKQQHIISFTKILGRIYDKNQNKIILDEKKALFLGEIYRNFKTENGCFIKELPIFINKCYEFISVCEKHYDKSKLEKKITNYNLKSVSKIL